MSNVCAGIGRGQMTVANDHIKHHQHVQALYEELLADVKGVHIHKQPDENGTFGTKTKTTCGTKTKTTDEKVKKYDSNYWLCTITLDEGVRVKGQENAYKKIVTKAVGGAAGVLHQAASATTDCQPNDNVEALRVYLDKKQIESRPVWKPMHKQPVYNELYEKVALANENTSTGSAQAENIVCYEGPKSCAYLSKDEVSESIFKVGVCLPAGPYVLDEDVKYICDCIKSAIVK